jgi:hypothetical protein
MEETSRKQVASRVLLDLFLDPEDDTEMFLQHVG